MLEYIIGQGKRNCVFNLHDYNNDITLYLQLDTNRTLDWIQSVKQATGSVQMSALNEADAINQRGYYRIGKIKDMDIREGGVLVNI